MKFEIDQKKTKENLRQIHIIGYIMLTVGIGSLSMVSPATPETLNAIYMFMGVVAGAYAGFLLTSDETDKTFWKMREAK